MIISVISFLFHVELKVTFFKVVLATLKTLNCYSKFNMYQMHKRFLDFLKNLCNKSPIEQSILFQLWGQFNKLMISVTTLNLAYK